MCGIVGVIPKSAFGFDKKTEDSFYQMLYCDTLRGDDSTGVIMVENTTAFGIMKEAYAAPWVAEQVKSSKQGRAMFSRGKAMIGHNRAATRGHVTDENAHPFVVKGEFALVHNGTLYSHKELSDTTVDSHALAIHLEPVLNGEWDKEKFEEAVGKVSGAYAVACYSQNNNSVYLFRNSQRPLSICETPEGFFFASEIGMLYWILGRNGVTLKDHSPVLVKENTLYRIDLDNNKMEVIDFVPKKATPVVTKATGKGKGNGSVTRTYTKATNGDLSKSEFKRMKRRWLDTETLFWCDDFVEKDFPLTLAEGAFDLYLMGEIDELSDISHTVQAEFDVRELPPKEAFLNCLYRGRVTDMQLDKNTGHITVFVSSATKVPTSRKALSEVQPTVH